MRGWPFSLSATSVRSASTMMSTCDEVSVREQRATTIATHVSPSTEDHSTAALAFSALPAG